MLPRRRASRTVGKLYGYAITTRMIFREGKGGRLVGEGEL